LLMGILVIGYLAAGSIVVTITSLLAVIPTVGPALAMPFQFLSQAAHGYVSLIILASIFLFYYRTGYLPSLPAPRGVTEDTSQTPADEPLQAPVEKAESKSE